jgi:hypothetical protein
MIDIYNPPTQAICHAPISEAVLALASRLGRQRERDSGNSNQRCSFPPLSQVTVAELLYSVVKLQSSKSIVDSAIRMRSMEPVCYWYFFCQLWGRTRTASLWDMHAAASESDYLGRIVKRQ